MRFEGGVLPLVVRAGGGSVRDTLSLLDQLIAGSEGGTIQYARAVALLGYTHGALLDEVVATARAGRANRVLLEVREDNAGALLMPDSLARATAVRFDGLRADTGTRSVWGAGFQMAEADYGRRADPGTFGHGGWGGSLAFADARARLGFAYVTNHLCGFPDVDPRRTRLIEAVYDAL